MALSAEIGVPATIPLERTTRRVKGEAVDLDDQVALGPVEVDLVAADARVRPRLGEPCCADQLEESAFRLRSRERGFCLDRVPQRTGSPMVGVALELLIEGMVRDEAVDLCLLDRSCEVSVEEVDRCVEERPRG